MKKKIVTAFEIWMPSKTGGAYHWASKQPMKMVAFIVNGVTLKLEKDFYLEKRYLTKEQADEILKKINEGEIK